MNAALGLRLAAGFLAAFFGAAFFGAAFFAGAFFAAGFFAAGFFAAGFLAGFFADFLAVAIALLPGGRSLRCDGDENGVRVELLSAAPAPHRTNIPHSRRRGVQILRRFARAPAGVLRWREWVALALRRTGCAFGAGSHDSCSRC